MRAFIAAAAAAALIGSGVTTEQGLDVRVSGRAVQPGEVLNVSVHGFAPGTTARVRVFGRTFLFDGEGDGARHALVGIDLDVRPGPYTATIEVIESAAPRAVATHALTVRAKTFRTRQLTVEPRFVEPPPAEQQRIEREAARLAALWTSQAPRGWTTAFTAPVTDAATSAFGSRSVFNGQVRSPHGGADFASPTGRPVTAPGGGRVVLVDDLYFTGQTVVIDHGLGLVSLFAHLSGFNVTEGQVVARGDLVGRVGATGRVTGPHLHWTVRLGGARVDPLSLIAATAAP